MNRTTRLVLGALIVAGTAVGLGGLATASTTPTVPTVSQLCAATSLTQVNALLAGVADADLVGQLKSLTGMNLSSATGLLAGGQVTLADVKKAVGCTTVTTAATTSATVTATASASATATAEAPSSATVKDTTSAVVPVGSTGGNSQVSVLPSGGVNTGDGSAR